MLKSIDVLIGLAVVMLALSMAVTVMTQFITTAVNSRGRHLRRGLVDLLGLLDPTLKGEVAAQIATTVLTHPLVSATRKRLGSVVHREEFTKLLLHLAAGDDERCQKTACESLKAVLETHGVSDPAATLKSIRTASLELEAATPELAGNVRNTLAILQEARSDYVAKVNNWFDQTMDRVSQRFTASTRAITFVAAFLLAAVLQVDAILLVNRLSADDKMRDAFLAQARTMHGAGQPETEVTGSPEGAVNRQYLSFLADHGVIAVPRTLDDWRKGWGTVNPFGILVTGLLLSLGAPFWYKQLGHLLQLRPVLAEKDDQQRAQRQGAKAPASDGGAARKPTVPDERASASEERPGGAAGPAPPPGPG